MIHPHTELRFASADIGYGVFATRPIPRGTVLWTLCALDRVFTPQEAATLPDASRQQLAIYAYIDAAGNHVLCWDHGRYINHNCEPSMLGVGNGIEIAVRDLNTGDHVTCEYGGLNLLTPLPCQCGAPRCRGLISAEDALERWHEWDAAVAAALRAAARVEQPLLPFVREAALFADWIAGRKPVPSHRAYYHDRGAPDGAGAGPKAQP